LVPLPGDRKGPTAVIHVSDPALPNIALTHASAAARQDPRAAGRIRLELEGHGVSGVQTLVTVFDGAIPVGSTTHQWTGDGEASLELNWWPIADGPRILRVEAAPAPNERARADNQIEVAIDVEARPVSGLVYERGPRGARVGPHVPPPRPPVGRPIRCPAPGTAGAQSLFRNSHGEARSRRAR